jgi:hypothetical protein
MKIKSSKTIMFLPHLLDCPVSLITNGDICTPESSASETAPQNESWYPAIRIPEEI